MPTPKSKGLLSPSTSNLNLRTNLKNKYVAFIDVMGFTNLVSRNQYENLETYFSRITQVLDELKQEKATIESFMISDSIILIAPDTTADFIQLITAIRRIQSTLLFRKILLRGAVSYGEVYFNRNQSIIVGKGYIRAYKLEGEAVYPRVIIDPAIVSRLGTDRTDFLEKINGSEEYTFEKRLLYVHRDFTRLQDNAIFVDYANKVIQQTKITTTLQKTHEMIKEYFYAEQSLYSKYVWLRDYFYECLTLTYQSLDSPVDDAPTPFQLRLQDWQAKFSRL